MFFTCLFFEFLFQILDFSNWDEDEKVCEVQQISIEPLQCEENNITSCSDNFTLSNHDEILTFSLKDINSSVLEENLRQLQVFQDRGEINVTSVNGTEGNSKVFQVSFCLDDPRGVEVLNGTVADDQALFLNITRLVQGQSAKDFHLVFDQPDLPSETLKPSSTLENIEKVVKKWFSKNCEIPSEGK